eukprot:12483094-Alexandrium_andersonii.AAC.1
MASAPETAAGCGGTVGRAPWLLSLTAPATCMTEPDHPAISCRLERPRTLHQRLRHHCARAPWCCLDVRGLGGRAGSCF